jgi:predicted O-linked N-acetylglucosamine transferase (SPINDLY family)
MDDALMRNTLKLADQMRQAQQWGEAVRLYSQLEQKLPDDAAFHHNFALSLLGAKQAEQAVVQSDKALALRPELWQSVVVKVRALVELGQTLAATMLLQTARLQYPERAAFALELATITLHQQCDARLARQLVQPHLNNPDSAIDANLTDIIASLYDRDEPPQSLNNRAMQFARTHLDRNQGRAVVDAPTALPLRSGRKRLGLISPHFNCSPVFFFCSGALTLLAQEFDLYFFSRSHVADWATAELRLLACEWFDVANLSAEPLDTFVRAQALDVLVDLGGWMDPIALKAISTKPATHMYKWVGGQSITTGLSAFDGFITDIAQTPTGFDSWFTEPLLRLPGGYVSYTPPAYMPAPVAASAHRHLLGVIANPVKVSQPFLAQLAASLQRTNIDVPIALRFIDKRYGHSALQARILQALAPAQAQLGEQLRVEFVTPASHLEYLTQVGQLSAVAETFPYTGGLTAMEGLSLGVPCSGGQLGTLFCERHAHAHQCYLQSPAHPQSRAAPPQSGQARQSLVPAHCPRVDHAALAASLAQLFATGTVEMAVA